MPDYPPVSPLPQGSSQRNLQGGQPQGMGLGAKVVACCVVVGVVFSVLGFAIGWFQQPSEIQTSKEIEEHHPKAHEYLTHHPKAHEYLASHPKVHERVREHIKKVHEPRNTTCTGGPEAACKCMLKCKVFGGDADRCKEEGPSGQMQLVNAMISKAMHTSNDQCDGMKCIMQCATELRCHDLRMEKDCRHFMRSKAEHGCHVECGKDDDSERDDDSDDGGEHEHTA